MLSLLRNRIFHLTKTFIYLQSYEVLSNMDPKEVMKEDPSSEDETGVEEVDDIFDGLTSVEK